MLTDWWGRACDTNVQLTHAHGYIYTHPPGVPCISWHNRIRGSGGPRRLHDLRVCLRAGRRLGREEVPEPRPSVLRPGPHALEKRSNTHSKNARCNGSGKAVKRFLDGISRVFSDATENTCHFHWKTLGNDSDAKSKLLGMQSIGHCTTFTFSSMCAPRWRKCSPFQQRNAPHFNRETLSIAMPCCRRFHRRKAGARFCDTQFMPPRATKEMTCRWIRQG